MEGNLTKAGSGGQSGRPHHGPLTSVQLPGGRCRPPLQAAAALLPFADTVCFCKLKLCGDLALRTSVRWHCFPGSICSLCVSMSRFGNSLSITNFIIITIFVMVTCDL